MLYCAPGGGGPAGGKCDASMADNGGKNAGGRCVVRNG